MLRCVLVKKDFERLNYKSNTKYLFIKKLKILIVGDLVTAIPFIEN